MSHRTGFFGRHAGALLLAVVGWLAWDAQAQPARAAVPGVTADRVLFGQSAKLSGSAGTFSGRQYRDGLMLAFDAANRAGGVHGRRIELLTLDDQNEPAKALANTRTLIDDRRVFALVGYTFTNPVRAALPMLQASGVPLVGAYTGTPELYDGSQPMVFAMRASFADELAAIIRHVDTIGYDRVAMVHYTTSLGLQLRGDVDERLRRVGRRLVVSGGMPVNAPDYLTAARGAVQPLLEHCPKLVILGVSGRDAAAVVQGMAAGKCPPAQFMARNIVDVGLLQQMLGQAARGVIITQVVPNPSRGAHPLVSGYRALLKQRDAQARPDFAEFEGYIAGRVVVLALQRAGRELDRAGFVRAMESVTLEGPDHFRVQFGAGRRAGSRYTNIVMVSDKERITD
ncbi:ABC transporter substrate-binding protein [Schlegelella sp. S2-27]|uniref:ABC transporter substrate-binding protein n=1 Tax=Caldimonas mangrovi TaxID=2944811 RepID=A0ABT0YVX0_9BURK|nr:ABC transporter substrate-binding protein [Caldimonas mangrovi]MCM5682898.1 ABC transporter substrate-binding protein [Caldimonas mangrovi]